MSHLWAEIHPLSGDAISPLLLYAKQLSLSTDLLLKNRKYFRFFCFSSSPLLEFKHPMWGILIKEVATCTKQTKRDYTLGEWLDIWLEEIAAHKAKAQHYKHLPGRQTAAADPSPGGRRYSSR